jgi:3-hydroxyisobutyrate dehydrogenase
VLGGDERPVRSGHHGLNRRTVGQHRKKDVGARRCLCRRDRRRRPGIDQWHDLGRRTVWLGRAGAGSRAKLVLNNWLVDLVESTAETLRFASALGIDPAMIIDLLDAPIGSPYAVDKGRSMLEGDFTLNFALRHAVKDADLALDAAESVGIELALTQSLIESWHRAVTNGRGDEDLSVVYAEAWVRP